MAADRDQEEKLLREGTLWATYLFVSQLSEVFLYAKLKVNCHLYLFKHEKFSLIGMDKT